MEVCGRGEGTSNGELGDSQNASSTFSWWLELPWVRWSYSVTLLLHLGFVMKPEPCGGLHGSAGVVCPGAFTDQGLLCGTHKGMEIPKTSV